MRFIFTFIFLLTFVFSGSAQMRTVDFAELEKIIEVELAATKTPGASVAVISGDKIIFGKGFGATSAEGGSSITPDTLFRMGSTTKMFTAMNADEMKRFTGKFAHAPQEWEVFVKDEKVFLKEDGKDFELTKIGKDRFAYEQGEVLFVPNEKGEIEHIFMGLYAARKVS